MKTLAWLLAPLMVFLLAVPLAISLGIAAVTTPALASDACLGLSTQATTTGAAAGPGVPTTRPSDSPTPPTASTTADALSSTSLPAPGAQRRVSLDNPPSPIPTNIQALYVAAATRYQLPWTLLAGIGMEETNHGGLTVTSSAGAQGLMQFLPATFASYGVDGDGDGRADITDNADSIFSAANYLVATGARGGPDGIRQALFAYNHAVWYVNDVLYYAAAYTGDDIASNPCVTVDTATGGGAPVAGTGPASGAVTAALQWIGTPYSWGGGTAAGPTTGICCSPGGQDARTVVGFDCSGLVLYAYAQIGVSLPHLADDITYRSGGQTIPRDFNQMQPGDVIGFSYTPGGRAFHVGIYLGGGQMVNSDGHGVSIATLTTGYYSRLAWHIVRFVN